MDKIKIDLGFATLVAEKGTDKNYNEIFIGLEDKNGCWLQNLAIVGQKYHYTDGTEVVQDNGIDIRVYADKDNEDYTHHFEVGVYEEDN